MTPKSFFESKAIVDDSGGIGEVNREYETEGLPSRVEYLLNTEEGSLLARRWVCDVGGMSGQRSRSDLACSIAAELARYMVPTPEIEAAIKYWCKLHEYDKDDRWVRRTVCAAYSYAESRGGTHKQASREMRKLLHGQLDILAQGPPEIIPTGIDVIDKVHGGILEVGELGLLGARPSAGKSALSIEIMDAATSAGYPTVFFSLEMSPRAVANRYFTRLGIDVNEIHNMSLGQLHTYVDEKFRGKQPLDFQATFKLEEICKSIIDYGKRGYRFAVIDYSTMIVTGLGDERRHYEKITVDLARTAKEADVAILLIHPLKKEYEARGGRPKMGDLVYAGDYAADCILALQYLYQESAIPENASRMVFHMLKNRNRGFKNHPYIELHFNTEQQCFSSPRY
jgi:replicative DNA helicase